MFMEYLLLTAVIVVPYSLLGIVCRHLYKEVNRISGPFLYPIKYGFIGSIISTTGLLIWAHYELFAHPGPQNGIALFFFPIYSVIAAAVIWLILAALFAAVSYIVKVKRGQKFKSRYFVAAISVLVIFFSSLFFVIQRSSFMIQRSALLNIAKTTTDLVQLESLYKMAVEKEDVPLMVGLAENELASSDLLSKMYAYSKSAVNQIDSSSHRQYYYDVLTRLAENRNTPPDILAELAKNPSCSSSVAGNPNTPITVLEALSKSSEYLVKLILTNNSNATESILLKLKNDSDKGVRLNAESRLKRHDFHK